MVRESETVSPPSSAMVDPEAAKLLEIAAAAAGLTVVQLVDLVHDSGALGLPPDSPDGITTTLTLGEVGKRMWDELQRVMLPERAKWFGELLPAQQIALVVTLSDRGYRPEIISRELNLTSVRIREWLDQYAEKIGAQVTQVRLSTIAGHVQLAAEKAMAGLQANEDWKGYFGVQEKLVKVLQSLGIVDQAIHRVEVTHKMEDNTKAEIDAMLELERKQQKRKIEIANAQGVKLDAVPQLDFEKDS